MCSLSNRKSRKRLIFREERAVKFRDESNQIVKGRAKYPSEAVKQVLVQPFDHSLISG